MIKLSESTRKAIGELELKLNEVLEEFTYNHIEEGLSEGKDLSPIQEHWKNTLEDLQDRIIELQEEQQWL